MLIRDVIMQFDAATRVLDQFEMALSNKYRRSKSVTDEKFSYSKSGVTVRLNSQGQLWLREALNAVNVMRREVTKLGLQLIPGIIICITDTVYGEGFLVMTPAYYAPRVRQDACTVMQVAET